MIKYYYNPEDYLVKFSDSRKFYINYKGNICESYEPFKLFEYDIPCSSSAEAFERLIDGYTESLAEELEDKRRELIVMENKQLKSINLLRKEVGKYE